MTSAERAKEIVQEICKPLDGGRPYLETPHRKLMAEIIAAAITQAENDKLEEAHQRLLGGHDEAWGNPAEQHGWDQAARRIEALKSKD